MRNCGRFVRLPDKNGKPAYIKIKINHITDPVMVDKLYEAVYAGVEVDLSVRGNCSLVTDKLPGNCHMRINGIIDRYLEHSRIFVFAAGGAEKVYLGSADWMPRNLSWLCDDPLDTGSQEALYSYYKGLEEKECMYDVSMF